jgi:hypothetical protein
MSTPTSLYGSKGGDTTTPPANPSPPPPRDTSHDDVMHADGSSATLYGGKGQDTAVFEGSLSDYTIELDLDTWQILVTDRSGRDGTHHLDSIEQLRFADTTIELDGLRLREAGGEWQLVDGFPTAPPEPIYDAVTLPGDFMVTIAIPWDEDVVIDVAVTAMGTTSAAETVQIELAGAPVADAWALATQIAA